MVGPCQVLHCYQIATFVRPSNNLLHPPNRDPAILFNKYDGGDAGSAVLRGWAECNIVLRLCSISLYRTQLHNQTCADDPLGQCNTSLTYEGKYRPERSLGPDPFNGNSEPSLVLPVHSGVARKTDLHDVGVDADPMLTFMPTVIVGRTATTLPLFSPVVSAEPICATAWRQINSSINSPRRSPSLP